MCDHYTVVYQGSPYGVRILNGEPATGLPVCVQLGNAVKEHADATVYVSALIDRITALKAEIKARDERIKALEATPPSEGGREVGNGKG